MYKALLAVLIAALPLSSYAAISINEIAWMGTDVGGANCEWIELYNSGNDAVLLSTWTITIENNGSTPRTLNLGEAASVKFSGITGNGYYLVARNSGECGGLVPGSSADWLGSFGNGISNTGTKITLAENGESRDVVDASAGWTQSGIGGVNSSGKPKETPQRAGGGWLVAAPTPRGLNIAPPLEELPEEEEGGSSTPVVTIGGTAPLVPVTHPVPKLFVDAGPSRIIALHADTPYTATVYDSTGKIRTDATVTWSFGDGGAESGRSVTYAYREPGDYVAVARARITTTSAIATITVRAVPASVRIAEVSDTGIVLANDGEHLADLSSWKFTAGKKKYTLPQDTVIPPGKSVVFSKETLRMPDATEPELHYPSGKIASVYEPAVQPQVAGTSTQEVREVDSPPVGVTSVPTYEKGIRAPIEATEIAPVGAALPATGTVILKEENEPVLAGITSFFDTLVASFTSFVVP